MRVSLDFLVEDLNWLSCQGKAMKMKIWWFGPARPTRRQSQELARRFGAGVEVDFRGLFENAARCVADFRRSNAAECVIVGPMSVLEHVLREGLKPLWAEAEVVEKSHPEAEWRVRNKFFRHVRFRRLVELLPQYFRRLHPVHVQSGRPLIGWFSDHDIPPEIERALEALYGQPIEIRRDRRPIRDADTVLKWKARCRVHDVVLTAPLRIFADLSSRPSATFPLKVEREGGVYVLRRFRGLVQEFEELD